jgi:hypothetical protein
MPVPERNTDIKSRTAAVSNRPDQPGIAVGQRLAAKAQLERGLAYEGHF